MSVLIVLVFVSIVLVAGGLLLFVFSMHQRDFEHSERLSLLPLSDLPHPARPAPATAPTFAPPAEGPSTPSTSPLS